MTSTPTLIGVCGTAGSGKDTVADILVLEHGFVKVAFADPLKRICRELHLFTDEQLWGPSRARNAADTRYPRPHGPFMNGRCLCCSMRLVPSCFQTPRCFLTPRFALQQLGTEWGRHCYPGMWIDYAMGIADYLLTGECTIGWPDYSAQAGQSVGRKERVRGVVISDVRFPNEEIAIHTKGGRVWRTTHGDGLTSSAGGHASETYIDSLQADYVFPDTTVEELPGIVRSLMGLHFSKRRNDAL
jgi:hypothetical protein